MPLHHNHTICSRIPDDNRGTGGEMVSSFALKHRNGSISSSRYNPGLFISSTGLTGRGSMNLFFLKSGSTLRSQSIISIRYPKSPRRFSGASFHNSSSGTIDSPVNAGTWHIHQRPFAVHMYINFPERGGFREGHSQPVPGSSRYACEIFVILLSPFLKSFRHFITSSLVVPGINPKKVKGKSPPWLFACGGK